MPADAAGEPPEDARRHAALCHVSALAGLLVPVGFVVGPLVAWIVLRDTDPFVDRQGRHAVDVNLAFLVLELLLAGLAGLSALLGLLGPLRPLVLVPGLFLFGLVGLAHLAVVVYAAIQASEGHDVEIPFRIPLMASL